jgi:glycosyltransferase involved in cell wall biosynthesis
MLPLGVVIPTKNSMPYLPSHLEAMREWQDLAEEIVVVDSFSTDGSV